MATTQTIHSKYKSASHNDAFCAGCGGDWRNCYYPRSWPDRHGKRWSQFCEKCQTETVYELSPGAGK